MNNGARVVPLLLFLLSGLLSAQTARLTIDSTTKVSDVSPTLYGLMIEEINHALDGGLYAEMVRNRTFRHQWFGYEGWTIVSHGHSSLHMSTGKTGPSRALPHSLQLTITQAAPGSEGGVANSGYWNMAVRPSTNYEGSLYAKSEGVGPAHIRLIANDSGATLAEASVDLEDGSWRSYKYTLQTRPKANGVSNSHLEITFAHAGTVNLQLVSLFPPTYHARPNGNRADLMDRLAAMHPHFLRLPGGNFLEGNTIQERFNWKQTVGPLVDRPTHQSPWGYQSSDGLGLLEYLEWCEDLNMEPVLAVYAGYSLGGEHVVGSDLNPFVQDALDEIEYVTGDPNTKWGAMRASNGHPTPFPLHYVEIGNEDQFDKAGTYPERFAAFAKAIREKYPDLKLIATIPKSGSTPDVIDDHYYQSPDEFFDLVHHYDTMDRKGPKVFVGEWATRTGSPTPDFGAALGDAAWMTGLERNSDVVVMASYAPLFTNVHPGALQWESDLIGFDAARSYGSPSYWAQVLFSNHIGNQTVRTTAEAVNPRFFWSATVSPAEKILHLKLVNASDQEQPLVLDVPEAAPGAATMNRLHANTRWATNDISHPDAIRPEASELTVQAHGWAHNVPGYTIEVIDMRLR